MRRFTITTLLLAGVLGLPAGIAVGRTAWRIQSTPNPTDRLSANLKAVACPTATDCIAVGGYTNSADVQESFVERWNGTKWAVQATPKLPGAEGSLLQAVACGAVNSCTAVGFYDHAGTDLALAERWNGRKWTVQPIPQPGGSDGSGLNGVKCPTTTVCTAVGFYDVASATRTHDEIRVDMALAERWNGQKWFVQPTPKISGAGYSIFQAVGCPTAKTCTAVGDYENSSNLQVALAERWNGTDWVLQTAANPSGGQNEVLNGVACPTANICTAVGSYENSSDVGVTLGEWWNGTDWVVQTTPNPNGSSDNELYGVSCTGPSACTAVGDHSSDSGDHPLVEVWNGTVWQLQLPPSPPGSKNSDLYGVSCSASRSCSGVGDYLSRSDFTFPLVERWNGTRWQGQSAPSTTGPGESYLYEVVCPTARACTAVGESEDSSGREVTLAERWNGTKWTVQSTPNPKSDNSYLNAVKCPAPKTCMSVGQYEDSSRNYEVLAARWNGKRWQLLPIPYPKSATESDLYDLACSTAKACTAVGSYETSSGYETLVERWNGTRWQLQSSPNPKGSKLSGLDGVACPGVKACIAVGASGPSFEKFAPLVERWNGKKWLVAPSAKARGATSSTFSSVACRGEKACTAVGYSSNRSRPYYPLAEVWSGATWRVQHIPDPKDATESQLYYVSCPSVTACTAVGYYEKASGISLTLAERRNGTKWSVEPTPNAAGSQASYLGGVACPTTTLCTAVGDYENTSGVSVTLAERWSGPGGRADGWSSPPTRERAGTELPRGVAGDSPGRSLLCSRSLTRNCVTSAGAGSGSFL